MKISYETLVFFKEISIYIYMERDLETKDLSIFLTLNPNYCFGWLGF